MKGDRLDRSNKALETILSNNLDVSNNDVNKNKIVEAKLNHNNN